MASRTESWFDDEKLFPGERLVRTGRAWFRAPVAPRWWEGELVLTTDRLFFLPDVDNQTIGYAAFWLADVTDAATAGRNRLLVIANDRHVTFELHDGSSAQPRALRGKQHQPWLAAIASVLPAARPSSVLTGETRRRAVG